MSPDHAVNELLLDQHLALACCHDKLDHLCECMFSCTPVLWKRHCNHPCRHHRDGSRILHIFIVRPLLLHYIAAWCVLCTQVDRWAACMDLYKIANHSVMNTLVSIIPLCTQVFVHSCSEANTSYPSLSSPQGW